MQFDPALIPPRDVYARMIETIVPRPIAWVSTLSAEGVPNLAPFSFFTGVTSKPPTLVFCVGNNSGGVPKDTARNIMDTGEFVVNLTPLALAEAMVKTSGNYPPQESEIEAAGLSTAPSARIKPPRIVGTPAQFECTLYKVVDIGEGDRITSRMIIGRIELLHVDDAYVDAEGRIDFAKLDVVARLGGPDYGQVGTPFSIARPR
jgi:flavin reductase (DIM6/NTAB) family NADH-FMN oxidoreductase RutF